MILILIGAFLGLQVNSTLSYEDCKAKNFEPKACSYSEAVHKFGKKIEKL